MKINKGIIIGIIAGVVLVGGALTVYFLGRKKSAAKGANQGTNEGVGETSVVPIVLDEKQTAKKAKPINLKKPDKQEAVSEPIFREVRNG